MYSWKTIMSLPVFSLLFFFLHTVTSVLMSKWQFSCVWQALEAFIAD